MQSNATAAAEQVGLVHDPMAMQPFIGYNVKVRNIVCLQISCFSTRHKAKCVCGGGIRVFNYFLIAFINASSILPLEMLTKAHHSRFLSSNTTRPLQDYFAHWLDVPALAAAATPAGKEVCLPKIFNVNWFQRDADTKKFVWPGYSENSRVLKWIIERCSASSGTPHDASGNINAEVTPIGYVPAPGAIDVSNLDGIDNSQLRALCAVDVERWREETAGIRSYFERDLMEGDETKPVPARLVDQLNALETRLGVKSS
jgi:GTP-dependent phosphoenolpyruvate carboxykinase